MFSDAQMVYFYCKSSDHRRRTFEDVTRTLIVGILDLSPPCLDYLYEKMIASSERHVNSQILLQDLLEELCTNHELLFICIDGLDECDQSERGLLLSLIGRITRASSAEQNVRFFVTSRKETDIERSLNSAIRLNIKPQHVEHDIGQYVKNQTARLRDRFGLGVGEEQDVRKDLLSKPQGKLTEAMQALANRKSRNVSLSPLDN
jgi:hypothetical protein